MTILLSSACGDAGTPGGGESEGDQSGGDQSGGGVGDGVGEGDGESGGNSGPLMPASPSDGCGMDGPTGAFHQTTQYAGTSRRFFVSVPDDYDPALEHRLVFGYHGGADFGGEAMRDYLSLETVSPEAEIFVYPDAIGSGFMEDLEREDGFFDEVLSIMSSNYCIDENRIFVTGQSQGGSFVTNLVCSRGDVVQAGIAVGANFALCGDDGCVGWRSASDCVGSADLRLLHGLQDDVITMEPWGVETLAYFTDLAGCSANTEPVDPSPCERYAGCDRDLQWCAYNGGHQIPSWYEEANLNFEQTTMDFFRSY